MLLLNYFSCLGMIFKLRLFLLDNWIRGSLDVFGMLIFDLLKLPFHFLLLSNYCLISIDSIHVIFNEMEGFGSLQTEMGGIKRPKSEIIDTDGP